MSEQSKRKENKNMNSKPFWKSKTFWLNAVGLVVVVLEYLTPLDILPTEVITTALGIGNLFLRLNGDSTKTKNLTLK